MGLSEKKRTQLVRDASPVLVEGEEVLDVTVGSAEVRRNGQKRRRRATVLVTDRRVIVFSKWLGTYDVQDYAFGRIAGVDHYVGPIVGRLNVRASGGGADIWQVIRGDVVRVAEVIRDHSVLSRSSGSSAPKSQPPEGQPVKGGRSVADELTKLARLRDDGVITPDEFATQKTKLLS